MLASFLPPTTLKDAVRTEPACAALFGAKDVVKGVVPAVADTLSQTFISDDHLRNCKVAAEDSTLHITAVGPFEFGGPGTRLAFSHPDVFQLRETLRDRDMDVRGMMIVPMSSSAEVIGFPPIDVHHMNVAYGHLPAWFSWGISEESQCLPPLGTLCFGRGFGEYAFHLEKGEVVLAVDGEMLDARGITLAPGEEKKQLTFWMTFVLKETHGNGEHLRRLSSVYVMNPYSFAGMMAGYNNQLEVPREEDTVFWYSFRMSKAGTIVTTWFHSHSTTSVDGRIGMLLPGAKLDAPKLMPTYQPVHPAKLGYPNGGAALRARVMAPTQHVCAFANRFEVVNNIMVPRWASANCTSARFVAGSAFVVFIISTPTGYHSNEPREHWQPTMFYEADDGTSLYTTTYSTQPPGVHDEVWSYYDFLLWFAYGGDVQGPPSVSLLYFMMLISDGLSLAKLAIGFFNGIIVIPVTATCLAFGTALWPLVAIVVACYTRSCTVFFSSLLIGFGLVTLAFALALPGFHFVNDGDPRPARPPQLLMHAAVFCLAGLLVSCFRQQGTKKPRQAKGQLL